MSIFANTTEALVVGLTFGAAFSVFAYMGYQMLMIKVDEKIRKETKSRVDRHEDIYHGDR